MELSRALKRIIMREDITDAESRMLLTLMVIEQDEPEPYYTNTAWKTTANDIALRRELSYPGTLKILKQLETKGLVERQDIPGTKEKLWRITTT